MSVCGKNHVSLWEKSCRHVGKIMSICGKNHVGLWGKSRQLVGKFTSVCGKNHVGLWEKFVRRKNSLKNTHTCTGKKYQIIYVYLPRYRVSQRLFDGKFVET